MPKALLIGTGGVGIMAALALQTSPKCDLTVVIGSDYQRVIESGYNISSIDYGTIPNWRPSHIVNSVKEAAASQNTGLYDYVVICAKFIPDDHSRESLVDQVAKVLVPNQTKIVLIANGLGIEQPFYEAFPNNVVISGITKVACTNYKCNVVQKGEEVISFGYFENHPTLADQPDLLQREVETFIDIYSNPKIQVDYDTSVKASRWSKLIYNASFNTVAALSGLDTTRLFVCGARQTLLRPMIEEVYAIAKADGVDLDPKLKDFYLNLNSGYNFYAPSMLVDAQYGRLMEIEVIAGNPLKVAEKHNVAAPMLRTVYELLKLSQFKTKEKQGAVQIDDSRKYDGTNVKQVLTKDGKKEMVTVEPYDDFQIPEENFSK